MLDMSAGQAEEVSVRIEREMGLDLVMGWKHARIDDYARVLKEGTCQFLAEGA